ncbi:unnamed protein product, partial [Lampetra planeri]
ISDVAVNSVKPPTKRRRILDPSAIVPVPIYSNKVNSSLQLKPKAPVFSEKEQSDNSADDNLWSQFSSRGHTATISILSDSEEEEEKTTINETEKTKKLEAICCSPPPPPEHPVQKQSRQVKKKISEIDRKLKEVNSLLSPGAQGRRTRRRQGLSPPPVDAQLDDDDVIILDSNTESQDSLHSSSVREIPLKIRCRTEVHKLLVQSTTPFSDVIDQLSVILKVPATRLLLLREAVELPTDSTISELGLGIADIIDCVVVVSESERIGASGDSGLITVRLQSKDRDSMQEFSLSREAALGSIFSQYVSNMPARARKNVKFHFDGSKVTDRQTPAQLDMEDGDIIEVWM